MASFDGLTTLVIFMAPSETTGSDWLPMGADQPCIDKGRYM